jgi:hypothetical protein
MTDLHISHNPGGNSGSSYLCGAESNMTYRTLAEGTADRGVDRFFLRDNHLADPELCRDCLEIHDGMPPAAIPAILTMDNPADLLKGLKNDS